MGESNTPLVDGLFPICTKDVFDAYHDPSVHIFLSIVFGIFGLVFLYYAIARRPRFEYFLLFAVCALQVGAYILRIYSDITDAFIALMVYSAAIAVAVGVMYSMLVRWTWIADRYYGKRVFDRGYGNNVVIGVVSVVLAGLLVAGIWVASTIWVVYLALILVMWLTSNVYLGIHRRMKPSMEERTIVMSTMESRLGYAPLVTSHKQLDNMLVFMIVLLTVELVKTIFLTVCFVLIPLFFITPLYYIFSIIPDLAYVVLLANSETMPLFEHGRHVPEVRAEVFSQTQYSQPLDSAMVQSYPTGSVPQSHFRTSEPMSVTVIPQ